MAARTKQAGATGRNGSGRTRATGACSFCGADLADCSCEARKAGAGASYAPRYAQEGRAWGAALEAEQAATVAHVREHLGGAAALVAARLLAEGHTQEEAQRVAMAAALGAGAAPQRRAVRGAAPLPRRADRKAAGVVPWTARLAAMWVALLGLVAGVQRWADDWSWIARGHAAVVWFPAAAALRVRVAGVRMAVEAAVATQVGGHGRHALRPALAVR